MSAADCIFCKIVAREVPSKIVHEDEDVVAFRDLNPQAPTHLLVVPRRHIARTSDLTRGDEALAGKLVVRAAEIARAEGIAESGYRLLFNCNRDAGQAVFHIHLHLLGGRRMSWPPG